MHRRRKGVDSSDVLARLVAWVMIGGCAHEVSQDAATGPDGRISGAEPMELHDGVAIAKGIVTYPGGDRVDWKSLLLPGKGSVDLELSWRPPRPGLQVAMDVFDAQHAPLEASASRRNGQRRLTVHGVHQQIFVRIYAVDRGDAGRYQLVARFRPTVVAEAIDWFAQEIPDPPPLPAVPVPTLECDDGMTFDPDHRREPCRPRPCNEVPPGWPCVGSRCPNPPDPSIPACAAVMPCPTPPDRRIKACLHAFQVDCAHPTPDMPLDACRPGPVIGRIIAREVMGDELVVTIGVGTDRGVARTWRAFVLMGAEDNPLPGGEVLVVRVDKQRAIGKVKLTIDQIAANPRVRFEPPP
jgi:hypothetical protein